MQTRVLSRRVDGHHMVRVVGDLDLVGADQLTESIELVDDPNVDGVTVDVGRVDFCDCAGLSALINAHHRVTSTGRGVRVVGVDGPVRRLIDLTGTDWLLAAP